MLGRRGHDEVHMIGHKHVRVDRTSVALTGFIEAIAEDLEVDLRPEDC